MFILHRVTCAFYRHVIPIILMRVGSYRHLSFERVFRHRTDVSVCRARTAAPAWLLCGGGTTTASPCATRAVCTISCTASTGRWRWEKTASRRERENRKSNLRRRLRRTTRPAWKTTGNPRPPLLIYWVRIRKAVRPNSTTFSKRAGHSCTPRPLFLLSISFSQLITCII